MSGQGRPARLSRIDIESLILRAKRPGPAAKRDEIAGEDRVRDILRRFDALLARQTQFVLGGNGTHMKLVIAGNKDAAVGGRSIQAAFRTELLDADRTLQGHRDRLIGLIPNYVIDVGTGQNLIGVKTGFGIDIEFGELEGLRRQFVAHAAGRRDADALGLNIGFARSRHGACIRIHDGIRNGVKEFGLCPAVIVLGGDRLAEIAVGIGLFTCNRLIGRRHCRAKTRFKRSKVRTLFVGELGKALLIQLAIGFKASKRSLDHVFMRLNVGIPAVKTVVAAVGTQDARIDPALNLFFGISVVKVLTSQCIGETAVVDRNGNRLTRLHFAQAQIALNVLQRNRSRGLCIKALQAVHLRSLNKICNIDAAVPTHQIEVDGRHVRNRQIAANEHV